jgi:hypothetical protein
MAVDSVSGLLALSDRNGNITNFTGSGTATETVLRGTTLRSTTDGEAAEATTRGNMTAANETALSATVSLNSDQQQFSSEGEAFDA